MKRDESKRDAVAILGAGLTGLSSAYVLQRQGKTPLVLERDSNVGGLAKTVDYNGFRFDLGGHRFLTNEPALEVFVKRLLNQRYLVVPRSSNIYINGHYIKYPLQPFNAFSKVGANKSLKFIVDYLKQKITPHHAPVECLQDWVIDRFGQSLYEAFFKNYSEKVWGLDCTQIDSDWIAQRIQNLSLGKAIKSIILKRENKKYATLTDQFLYPSEGIGAIADNLHAAVNSDHMLLNTRITKIRHDNTKIMSIEYQYNKSVNDDIPKTNEASNRHHYSFQPTQVISTMPLTTLVSLLHPSPPQYVLRAASQLRSRDLILVVLMFNRNKVTHDSWVYFPEKCVPFGRIHEPKNWSTAMAPKNKTAVVTEHFCFHRDDIWQTSDAQLIDSTLKSMVQLNLVKKSECADGLVLRIKNAYPLFQVGYRARCDIVNDYLRGFKNLNLAGRTGSFRYYNMDQAMLNGISAAEHLLGREGVLTQLNGIDEYTVPYGESHEMCAYHTRLAT